MLARLDYLARKPGIDVSPVFRALSSELSSLSTVDPSSFLLQLDWIQYRSSFRPPVVLRPFSTPSELGPRAEIAVDVRRLEECDLSAEIRAALADAIGASSPEAAWLDLESPVPLRDSVIWSFNRLFWRHLAVWEQEHEHDYAAALPGGGSDGTNPDFWADRITTLVEQLDALEQRGDLPDELFVLELGVGSGQQARVWMDTFRRIAAERGRDYYDRLRYLMTDYSRDVLTTARANVSEHDEHVSTLELDATDVLSGLSFLRGKVMFAHSCNMYDNLPTDEIVHVGDDFHRVIVQGALSVPTAERLGRSHGVSFSALQKQVDRLLTIGPAAFRDQQQGVRFWADVWSALVLREEYERVVDVDAYPILADGSVTLRDVTEALPAGGRCHLSSDALASFASTLPLLHPQGALCVQDLFVTEVAQYREGFRGPGKLDGSIVNWLNGPLFAAVAAKLGYGVRFESFTPFRAGSNTVVMTASPRS